MLEYDQEAFARSCTVSFPAFGVPFSAFMPELRQTSLDLLSHDGSATLWTGFRIWSLVRVTGKWPLPVYGGDQLPLTLDACRYATNQR
jgi:hypothetical protein